MVEYRDSGRLCGNQLDFTDHARLRMRQRDISLEDVYSVADAGEVIESYPDDVPHPSELILGWTGEQPLHVVLGYDEAANKYIVVTVYEPDIDLWESNMRDRRR